MHELGWACILARMFLSPRHERKIEAGFQILCDLHHNGMYLHELMVKLTPNDQDDKDNVRSWPTPRSRLEPARNVAKPASSNNCNTCMSAVSVTSRKASTQPGKHKPTMSCKYRPRYGRTVRASAVEMPWVCRPFWKAPANAAMRPTGSWQGRVETLDWVACTLHAKMSGMLDYWTRMIRRSN